MKKILLSLLIACLCLLSGTILISCGNDNESQIEQEDPSTLIINENSFKLSCKVDNDYNYSYEFSWNKASNVEKYKVRLDEENEAISTDGKFTINDFSPENIHNLSISPVGYSGVTGTEYNLQFKGIKLNSPINVRIYGGENGDSFGFRGQNDKDFPNYILKFSELDIDEQTSQRFETGEYSYKFLSNITDRISPSMMSEIFNELNLTTVQNVKVKEVPSAFASGFRFEKDQVLEIEMPSNLSEAGVNLYASKITNPINVQLSDSFNETSNEISITWENTSSSLPIVVKAKTEDGYVGLVCEPGSTSGSIYNPRFDSPYKVVAEYESVRFNYIAENSYSFHLETPATEYITWHVENIQIPNPSNIRIEDEMIKWDISNYSEYVYEYHVVLSTDNEEKYNFVTTENSLSLESIYNYLLSEYYINHYGDFTIKVIAYGSHHNIIENNEVFTIIYDYSEYAQSNEKLRLKPTQTPQNITVNYQTNTVSWDANENVSSYYVAFKDKTNENSYTTYFSKISTNSFTIDDNLTQYSEIHIYSFSKYNVTTEDGIVTLKVPSLYIFTIEEE